MHEFKHIWCQYKTSSDFSDSLLDGLVSHKLKLGEFQDGIELLERGLDDVKKVMIMPNGA